MLQESLKTAVYCKSIRADDMQFYSAVRGWSDLILMGSLDGYQKRFEETSEFFSGRLAVAAQVSSQLIRVITEKTQL